MTAPERRLWSCLSARKVAGTRFNTQFPIGPFVCDFVSRGARLVIEVDGDSHGQAERADAARTQYIEGMGYRVIRFWNNDVMEWLDGVVAEIERVLADMPSPNPSRRREGHSLGPPRLPNGTPEGVNALRRNGRRGG